MTSPAEIRSPFPSGGRVPRVGKLRAGRKKSGTKNGQLVEYPSATDYWVVNADASTSQASADSFHAIYGDEPRVLNVTLPGSTPEEVLSGAWRLYGTGGLLKRKCSGPGGDCQERDASGEWVTGPCACDRERIPLEAKTHCAERWTLNVLLMDVAGLGVWQFDTGSNMAARDMAGVLQLLHDLRGSLLRVECKLRLVPRQVSPKGVAKTVWIAQLDAAVTPAEALALAGEAGTLAPQLPPSTLDEAPDDLLDHEVLQVIEAPPTPVPEPAPPPPPPPPNRPAPPATADQARAVALQLRDMTVEDRTELYELAGIPRGTKTPDVRALLCARWGELDLMDFGTGEPDLGYLLGEMRAHAARAEGSTTSMYDQGAPS